MRLIANWISLSTFCIVLNLKVSYETVTVLIFTEFDKESHIESSHSLRHNDAKLQTHPPSTLNAKMLDLPNIDVYNFRYKVSVGILMKLFFLSHKCINK